MNKNLLVLFFLCQFLLLQGQEDLSKKVDELFSVYDKGPGACIAIIDKSEVTFKKCYGNALLEHDIPMTEKSALDIGTLSMHFTAACILRLVEQGKLKLRDPLQKYLPEIHGTFSLQQMLNHTSGLRDYIPILMIQRQSLQQDLNQSEIFNMLKKQRALVIESGSEYRFSHSNYFLLAMVVEKVSGMSYDEFLQNEFFEPYGMESTMVYSDKNAVIKNRANAYQMRDGEYILDQRYNFNGYGDGRIYTSLDDMVKWISNLKKDKVYQKLIERGRLNNGKLMSYENGLEYGTIKGNEINAHNGYFGGFSAMYFDFMGLDKSIIVMSNDDENGAPNIAYNVAEAIIPNAMLEEGEEVPDMPEILKLETSELEHFVGSYFIRKFGYLRELTLQNDTLIYHINEDVTRKLVPITKNTFVIDKIPGSPKFQFSENELRLLLPNGDVQSYEKYLPSSSLNAEIADLEGSYYSEELNASLELHERDGRLVTLNGEEENLIFAPVMKNTFTSAHDGYIEFKDNGFTLNDYSLGAIRFNRSDL